MNADMIKLVRSLRPFNSLRYRLRTVGDSININIYPNPSISDVFINFEIGQISKVRIDIYDMNGKMIETLVDKTYNPGSQQVIWKTSGIAKGLYYSKFFVNESYIKINKIIIE